MKLLKKVTKEKVEKRAPLVPVWCEYCGAIVNGKIVTIKKPVPSDAKDLGICEIFVVGICPRCGHEGPDFYRLIEQDSEHVIGYSGTWLEGDPHPLIKEKREKEVILDVPLVLVRD